MLRLKCIRCSNGAVDGTCFCLSCEEKASRQRKLDSLLFYKDNLIKQLDIEFVLLDRAKFDQRSAVGPKQYTIAMHKLAVVEKRYNAIDHKLITLEEKIAGFTIEVITNDKSMAIGG